MNHWMRRAMRALAVVGLLIGAIRPARAFHSGGVAECEGCHSMHNSFEGSANVTGMAQFASGPYLLKAQDQSGSCLNCHQSADVAPTGYHISTAAITPNDATTPVEATPGGDFAWLKKTVTLGGRRGSLMIVGNKGERHGHNIVAADFGYTADPTYPTAPGGSYPVGSLACSSCHDPHGKYRRFADGTISTTGLPTWNSGSYNNSKDPIAGVSAVGVYRILGGVGYQPKSLVGNFAFVNQVPAAVSPSSYNRLETSQQSQTFVAYGQGMSEWCANCHGAMLQNDYVSGMKGLTHPAGNGAKLTPAIVANYNAYVRSGVMTNTDVNTAYSSLVPFELGTADYTVLKARSNLTGAVDRSAATTNNVSCLSCHRAHASGFESMLRFFYLNEFMTVADPLTNAAAYDPSTTDNKINYGYTVAQQTAAYYGRPASMFGPYARSQCNKCHAKD